MATWTATWAVDGDPETSGNWNLDGVPTALVPTGDLSDDTIVIDVDGQTTGWTTPTTVKEALVGEQNNSALNLTNLTFGYCLNGSTNCVTGGVCTGVWDHTNNSTLNHGPVYAAVVNVNDAAASIFPEAGYGLVWGILNILQPMFDINMDLDTTQATVTTINVTAAILNNVWKIKLKAATVNFNTGAAGAEVDQIIASATNFNVSVEGRGGDMGAVTAAAGSTVVLTDAEAALDLSGGIANSGTVVVTGGGAGITGGTVTAKRTAAAFSHSATDAAFAVVLDAAIIPAANKVLDDTTFNQTTTGTVPKAKLMVSGGGTLPDQMVNQTVQTGLVPVAAF